MTLSRDVNLNTKSTNSKKFVDKKFKYENSTNSNCRGSHQFHIWEVKMGILWIWNKFGLIRSNKHKLKDFQKQFCKVSSKGKVLITLGPIIVN
jgi:hypothetical protein